MPEKKFIYKNLTNSVKTFYGVTFNPGDVKEVPGFINADHFIRVSEMPEEPPASVSNTRSGRKSTSATQTNTTDEGGDS